MSTSQELKDRFSAGKTPSTEDYGALIDSIPSGGGGTIDSAISSTSQNALQNRVLYNELRVTESEQVRTATVGGVVRDIVVLDATEFDFVQMTNAGGSGDQGYIPIIPTYAGEDKAYIILNSDLPDHSNAPFISHESGTFLIKFCSSTESSPISVSIGYVASGEGDSYDAVGDVFSNAGWNLIDFNIGFPSSDYYGVSADADASSWIQSDVTEGYRTKSTEKPVKSKVIDLSGKSINDSSLSSTSEKAVQNKVLYNELRTTGTVSTYALSTGGVNYPIETIDADTLDTIYASDDNNNFNPHIFPKLDENKAYIVTNVRESGENRSKEFAFYNTGSFKIKFVGDSGDSDISYINIIGSSGTAGVENLTMVDNQDTSLNTWVSITVEEPFYSDEYYDARYYYGVNGDYPEITTLSPATQTYVPLPTDISLKQKISDLEIKTSLDSSLSSTSEKAVKNRVLYDEMRITDTVTRTANTVKLSNESSYREIIVLDADNFNNYYGNVIITGGSDNIGSIYELPSLDSNKAYKILNSDYKNFCCTSNDSGTYLLKFCGSSESESAENAQLVAPTEDDPGESYYGPHTFAEQLYPVSGEWSLVSFEYSFNYYLDDDDRSGYGVYYGDSPYDWVQDGATESVQPITETIIKTLKQKISELEQRIAALEN